MPHFITATSDTRLARGGWLQRRAHVLLLVVGCLCPGIAWGTQSAEVHVEGRVTGPDGVGLPDVTVRLERDGAARETTTGDDGHFVLAAGATGTWRLVVSREGFLTERVTLDVRAPGTTMIVVLHPSLTEEVTVVATSRPTRLADTPSSVATLDAGDLAAVGAARIDDALRSIPGFSLFRRSGSRTANPTAQGVSLRGVGATGASRSLVLDDGVPLNDPFGGWIYWGRVPAVALERIEVLRGGASDLYGSAALGGVIGFVRRDAARPFVAIDASYGSAGESNVAVAAGARRGRWSGTAAGEWFRTEGYVPVAASDRGSVDVEAGTRHVVVDLAGDARIGAGHRLFGRAAWFDEARENGTRLQVNDTALWQASAGWDSARGAHTLSVRGYASGQTYNQAFSAVAPGRDTETLTRIQAVPAEAAGGRVQWGLQTARGAIAIGGDHRVVSGRSHERVFTAGGVRPLSAGGTQASTGVFVHATVPLGSAVSLAGGLRYDRWENDAEPAAAVAPVTDGSRIESAVSPRVTLLAEVAPGVSVTAAAYRAFRAPTLNELYRGFRVGNTVTDANAALDAERLAGAESGVLLTSGGGRLAARGVVFWMEVHDSIANVTLSQAPALVTRRRENLGRVRSRGVEVALEARSSTGWLVAVGWLLSDASVLSYPADPALEGRRVPQVPRYAGSFRVRYDGRQLGTIGVQARFDGQAYEDDRNTLILRRYAVVDALWSRTIGRGPLAVFVAGENLAGTRYDIGRTPARLVGPPRALRVGIRIRR